MAKGGFFAGSDWVPYQEGALNKSSASSVRERKKQKTIKCPKCNREVPYKKVCVFCDNVLIK